LFIYIYMSFIYFDGRLLKIYFDEWINLLFHEFEVLKMCLNEKFMRRMEGMICFSFLNYMHKFFIKIKIIT